MEYKEKLKSLTANEILQKALMVGIGYLIQDSVANEDFEKLEQLEEISGRMEDIKIVL